MNIEPYAETGRCRTGTLTGLTPEKISHRLGFEPNCEDDPDKVVNSWGFKVDGVHCAIWDYKGSHHCGAFSTYGPSELLEAVFPDNYER